MKQRYSRHHNFFDWFCPDDELLERYIRASRFLDAVVGDLQFGDEYEWDIKNCLPINDDTYDVIRIWDGNNHLVICLTVQDL